MFRNKRFAHFFIILQPPGVGMTLSLDLLLLLFFLLLLLMLFLMFYSCCYWSVLAVLAWMLLLLCQLLLFFWQVTVAVSLTLAVIPLLLLLQNSLFDSHTHTQPQKSECCFKYLYLFCSSLFIRNAFFLWLERRIWFLFWNIQKRALFSQRRFRPTERNNYKAKYYG